MNKSYTWAIIILVILLVGAFLYMRNVPGTLTPSETATSTGQTGTPVTIEEYVRMNITTLSPIKEQVGGTFFVTSFQAQNGAGVVSYEDGHNAYTADFTYDTDSSGSVFVRTFTVRK